MKWIEMIRVRSSGDKVEEILQDIRARLPSCEEVGKGLERVLVWVHSEYRGDLAVIMTWNNDNPPAKSREGLLMAAFLMKQGSVSHAVWELASERRSDAGNRSQVLERTDKARRRGGDAY